MRNGMQASKRKLDSRKIALAGAFAFEFAYQDLSKVIFQNQRDTYQLL